MNYQPALRNIDQRYQELVLTTIWFVAAGPVSRILSATEMLRDGHSSGPGIAARL